MKKKKFKTVNRKFNEGFYSRDKHVCFLNCKKPSSHRHAPAKQLLFATLIEHCSGIIQSLPSSCAEREREENKLTYILLNNNN